MKIYNKILAHLFFLFFTCIVFSPYIHNQTFYLYWIIPCLDFKFLNNLKNIKINKNILFILLYIFIILIIYAQYLNILKILLIIFTLLYLKFLSKNGYFYLLYKYINLNIFIAFLQFIFGYLNYKIAYLIGPTNIAKMIWGSLAGPTFTNFYSIGFLLRGSGLSREVGFFASLLIITIIIYTEDKSIKKTKLQFFIFFIGYIVGFSKMSFILPMYFILKNFKKFINKIPLSISSLLILISLIIISSYLNKIGYFDIKAHETWIHRLSGYYVIIKYSIKELLYPLSNIEIISAKFNIKYLKYIAQLKYFTGLSHLILHLGIIIYFLFIILLKCFKITTFKYLLLTLLCFNTSYITVTSYIVLNYYFILNLGVSDDKKVARKIKYKYFNQ